MIDPHSYRYEIAGRDATTILTSRGCPYSCGFCAKTESRVRYRSIRRIEEEVLDLRDRWGYRALMLFDDTMVFRKARAEQLCDVFKRNDIVWRGFVRGDLIVQHGPDLVTTMAESGCVEVGIGVESGSDHILRGIHKGETVEEIRSAIKLLRSAGIRVKGFFIVGLPGENQSSLSDTRQFIEDVPLDDADFTVYQPYKGSPIWDNRARYDIAWEDDAKDQERFYKGKPGEYQCSVSTHALSSAEIVEARDELERQFRGAGR
jgi:radical SAM superfamily enzyme YgiQ (UPF0313 family)